MKVYRRASVILSGLNGQLTFQLSLVNRYAVDKQEKSDYHNQLEQQIKEKQDQMSRQQEDNFSMTKLMVK